MNNDFVFYIHTDILSVANFIQEKSLLKDFLKKVNSIFEVGRQLKADVFYSKENIEELKSYFEEFGEEFSPNIPNFLFDQLRDFKESKSGTFFFDVAFAQEDTQLAKSNFSVLDEQCIGKTIIVFALNEQLDKSLMFAKSVNDFGKVDVHVYNNAKDIWTFILGHIDKRNYHFSRKHGNCNFRAEPPNGEKVSQLLCSDLNAQHLLDSAIFDLREKSRFHYNFDEEIETFIVFPYEGNNPQNQYHAYHILKEEWDNLNVIPKSIRVHYNR